MYMYMFVHTCIQLYIMALRRVLEFAGCQAKYLP